MNNIASMAQNYPQLLEAIHEAGHAVIRTHLGLDWVRVTLADGHSPAHIEVSPIPAVTTAQRELEAIAIMAGPIAEAVLTEGKLPQVTVDGARADMAAARQLLGPRAGDKGYVDGLLAKTETLVRAHPRQISCVARGLLQHISLSPEEVRRLMASVPAVPPGPRRRS